MRLLSWFRTGRRTRDAAHTLYTAAVERARTPEFYAELEVPDSVDGRFDMIVLHMFLLLERLRQDDTPAQELSQALFDLMFQDMDRSLRELGVGDQSVGKRIKQMISAFYGRMRAYGEAADDPARLGEALGRNLYRQHRAAPTTLVRMAAYVQAARRELARQPFERLVDGEIEWPSLPLETPPKIR